MIANTSWTSSCEIEATVAPTWGAFTTRPSDCSDCSASRIGIALTCRRRAISSITSRCPGLSSPRMIAPRSDW